MRASLLIAAALGLGLTACAGSPAPAPSPTSPAPATPTTTTEATQPPAEDVTVVRFEVIDGRAAGIGETVDIVLGKKLRFVVLSDISEKMHIHGYDLLLDLIEGQEVSIEFVADIPGVFEVELEGTHRLLFNLRVS